MFGLRKTCSISRWHVWLFLHVMALLFSAAWCYDPCPESLRRSAAARPCNIPDSEVEKAFQDAKPIVDKRIKHEKKLVSEGRIVDKKIKSSDSTHQQANAPPIVRQMEIRQLWLKTASDILIARFNLTPEEACCGLSKLVLREPSAVRAVQQCVSNETIVCNASDKYRQPDGTCNNLNYTTWGSAFSCFCRMLPPFYKDDDQFKDSVSGGPLPEPRNISLYVHNNVNRPTNYVNHLYMFYGQLLDHDITLTAPSTTENNEAIECCPPAADNHPQCAPIGIRANDYFYSQYNMTCLNFVRSALCPYCATGPRAQVNIPTGFIDGSFIYGNSRNETDGLRNSTSRHLLRTQESASGECLLPPTNDPRNDQCSVPERNETCFLAGDQRVNQHSMLASLHTVFLRAHNKIANYLCFLNPPCDAETIFQETRKIVGAIMQVITYKEYLPPTLGNDRMTYFDLWVSERYTTYNVNKDPCMYTEFSTAAFRFGHSLINSFVAEYPPEGEHRGHYLRDMFFRPFELYNGTMDSLLRGSMCSPAQRFDRHMVPDVTNYLYRIRGNPAGLDLASFNIQRGRDHGLQGYTAYVEFCSQGEIVVQSFQDLVDWNLMYSDNMVRLQRTYRNVHDIDLFTGIISEKYKPEAVVGPTAACIIGLQFQKLKFGDRYYFEHGGQSCSFTKAQLNELRKVTFSSVLCHTTRISEIQKYAMMYASESNPIVSCNEIPTMNLDAWKK